MSPTTPILIAVVLAARFFARRRPYYAARALGLVWYGVSTTAEWAGATLGWNPGLYRWWYVTGALGVAAYLGAGSVYLHRSRAFGWLVVGGLAIGSLPALLAGQPGIGLAGVAGAFGLTPVLVRWCQHFAWAVLSLLWSTVCRLTAAHNAAAWAREWARVEPRWRRSAL